MKNIVLVGFMGTGKTSVGRVLAKKLKRDVLDVDQVVEQKEKRRIGDIFETNGEAYFRRAEKKAIHEIAERTGVVITAGGGAVLDGENVEALRKNGWLICLSAQADTIYARVKNSHRRPLLKDKDRLAEIKRLLDIRKPYYAKADFCFETDHKTPSQVAALILKELEGKLS